MHAPFQNLTCTTDPPHITVASKKPGFHSGKACPLESHSYSTSPGSSQPTEELKADFI